MGSLTRKRPRSATSEGGVSQHAIAPELIDDEEWTSGDFEVITSDHVRFRVPSYILFAASSVFRDAKTMAATNPSDAVKLSITFDDDLIETAAIFRHLLHLACNGTFSDGYWLPNTHLVIAFLQKWDCAVPLRLLIQNIKDGAMKASPDVSPLRAFAMAAIIGWEVEARDILRLCNFGEDELDDDVRGTDEYNLWGGNSLNPVRFPAYMFTDVRWEYSWALARSSWDMHVDDVPGEEFETHFGGLLAEVHDKSRPTHEGCKLLKEPTG